MSEATLVTKSTGAKAMGSKGTCKLDGCNGEVRGKGYCSRHYRAWRRGKLPKAPYRSCNEKGCTKPTVRRGLCEEHFNKTYAKAAAQRAENNDGAGESRAGGKEAASEGSGSA